MPSIARPKKSPSKKPAARSPKAAVAAAAEKVVLSAFSVGDHIAHHQFGEGEVLAIRDDKLTIEFATGGTKEILESFVKTR
jgi:hypothetical protein